MNQELDSRIKNEVTKALDNAESIWKEVGSEFLTERQLKTFAMENAIPTQIPGHPTIKEGKPEVANFIAFVLDIREATKHLQVAIAGNVSQLQRVLYETAAMNTAGAVVINHFKGGLTEYLGDGFLALIKVKDEKDPKKEVYSAYDAAQYCINEALNIVNEELFLRYKLPKLRVGVGLAYSKAIVTIVGINDNLHPKAIGECVYRASKLSSGSNEIHIDTRLKVLWPKEKNGKLHFSPRIIKQVDGFLLSNN